MPAYQNIPTGKYRFAFPFSVSQCIEFNNIGACLKSKTTNFSIGDVITVKNFFADDKTNDWVANVVLNGQNIPIPRGKLEKVDDSTPEKITSGSSSSQKSEAKNFFTPKNIIIGVVAIAAIFGILKVTKVI